ncbi:MAG TPA: hypothetical protein VFT58_00800 [Nitrososphaera sp.]|nr:hypothetical protein [Nitrososphaera sp.]
MDAGDIKRKGEDMRDRAKGKMQDLKDDSSDTNMNALDDTNQDLR